MRLEYYIRLPWLVFLINSRAQILQERGLLLLCLSHVLDSPGKRVVVVHVGAERSVTVHAGMRAKRALDKLLFLFSFLVTLTRGGTAPANLMVSFTVVRDPDGGRKFLLLRMTSVEAGVFLFHLRGAELGVASLRPGRDLFAVIALQQGLIWSNSPHDYNILATG